jgi:hypothetical protein
LLQKQEAVMEVEVLVVSETQEPAPISWVAKWERGLDPWHADAFIGTPAEGLYQRQGERQAGWYALDWCGNMVGFIPDGTHFGRNRNGRTEENEQR